MNTKLLNPKMRTMVVGLGGTGKKVLVQLKRRLMENGYADTNRQPDLSLICLDFDPAEECVSLRRDGRGEVRLNPDEMCWLDAGRIQNRLHNLTQPQNRAFYRDWYPDMDGEIIRMGSFRAGASQWRPLGRMGYFEHSERIQVVLRRALNRLLEIRLDENPADNPDGVAVYLACSLAGGTGGGTFMDVAYYMRSLPVSGKQIGLFLLPGIYAEYDVANRLNANTYASLKELSVFANQNEMFAATYPNGRSIRVEKQKESPFDQVFLFDNLLLPDQLTGNSARMTEIMAEGIYFDLVAGRVGDMYRSATTNMGAFTGAGRQQLKKGGPEAEKQATQSVFSTVGSLTLLLPSMDEVHDYLGRAYVSQSLLPGLRKFTVKKNKEDWDQEVLDKFPVLETKLNGFIDKALADCREWNPDFNASAAKDMAQRMVHQVNDHQRAWQDLDHWLGQLVTPGDKGRFHYAPTQLPDNKTDPEGPLSSILYDFKENLRSLLRDELSNAQKSQAEFLDLYDYLLHKAAGMRHAARRPAEKLKNKITAVDGSYHELKMDFKALGKSQPDRLGGEITNQAVEHWAHRFLSVVSRDYPSLILPVRVNILMALVLDQVRQEEIMSDAALAALDNARPEIARQTQKALETAEGELMAENSPVERSLADREFWQRLSEDFNHKEELGAVAEFLLLLNRQVVHGRKLGTLSPSRVTEMAVKFGIEKAARALNQDLLLDLHDYVDPRLRERELLRARHDYILTNDQLNSNESRKAFAASPSYSDKSSKSAGGENYEALLGDVGNVLDATPAEVDTYQMGNETDKSQRGRIYVRHLSLNHPASNLQGIREYYDAYIHYGQKRKLFHLDLNFVNFDEIIDPAQQVKVVTCGNPGCQEDISDLDPRTILCPHCDLPIRSRCGNPGCPENRLHERPEMQGENPQQHCPVCQGKVRTYWWRCDDHNLDIRTDSRYCPACREELSKGERDLSQVSRRDGVISTIDCPGCICDNIDDPFKISFLKVYDQVEDNRSVDAWEVYHQDTSQGLCPKCGAQLLPFCPYHKGEGRPHFVKRAEDTKRCEQAADKGAGLNQQNNNVLEHGVFICTSEQDHLKEDIYECSYCHLPLKKGAVYCPRCKRTRSTGQSPREGIVNLKALEDHPDLQEKLITKFERDRWLWFGLNEDELNQLKMNDRKGKLSGEPGEPPAGDAAEAFTDGWEKERHD